MLPSNSEFGHNLTAATSPCIVASALRAWQRFFKGVFSAQGAQHPRAGEKLTHRGGKIWPRQTA
jgi:hypothetical protein